MFLTTLHRFNNSFDVIILTECWLSDISTIPIIHSYTASYTQNKINQNSGVVVYVKDTWNYIVSEPDLDDADCLQIQLSDNITILAIYRPPSFRIADNFLFSLNTIMKTLSHSNKTLILAGDLNIDLLATTKNQNMEYLCLMAEHGLFPAITKPTRGNACLDHFFMNKIDRAIGVICSSDITDHDIVILGLTANMPCSNTKTRVKIKYNIDGIKKELRDVSWDEIFDPNDINKSVNSFCSRLNYIINKHTSKKNLKRSERNFKPWITPGLIRCMRHRDRLHMQSRKYPNDTLKRFIYTRYRNFCNDLLRKLKTKYDSYNLSLCEKNPKRMWRTVKDICHFPNSKLDSYELLDIEGAVNAKDSLDKCNKYFSTIGQTLATKILRELNTDEQKLSKKIHPKHIMSNSFFIKPTDQYEL